MGDVMSRIVWCGMITESGGPFSVWGQFIGVSVSDQRIHLEVREFWGGFFRTSREVRGDKDTVGGREGCLYGSAVLFEPAQTRTSTFLWSILVTSFGHVFPDLVFAS